ncbi:MAG: arginine deiminase family protein [Bacteroidia bacterium]
MKPIITSEYAPLEKVLVHTPGDEHHQLIPWIGDHPLMGPNPRQAKELQKDHGDLKRFLCEEIGEENVLEISDLLVEIFEQADASQRQKILKDTLHGVADQYMDHLQARGIKLANYEAKSLVRDLIVGYPRKLRLNNNRLPKVIIPPKRELMWVRDSSAATPVGVSINAMSSSRRQLEPALLRTLFKYHSMFDDDSIYLDLVGFLRQLQEDDSWSGLHLRYLMEGGNVLILSEDSIAIGVGQHDFLHNNRTTRAGFQVLVKKLFEADPEQRIRRVYLVNVPDLRGFIHLDTVFNMFAPQAGIVMPYVFGYPRPNGSDSASKVLQQFMHWLRRDMGFNQSDLSMLPTARSFEHAGKVEVYDREHIKKAGKVERLPQTAPYFLDQLIEDGLIDINRIAWIGGDPSDYASPFEHLRVALFEQHNMAGNIFTTSPYRAIAYHRNPVTTAHLEKKMKELNPDARLMLMSSNEIRTDNGGPHCLTMPLKRKAGK